VSSYGFGKAVFRFRLGALLGDVMENDRYRNREADLCTCKRLETTINAAFDS
jgi:hypothetical protein